MPHDEDASDSEVLPKTRDRLRSAFLRVSDALRDWFKASAAKETTETARLAMKTAVEGGLAVGIGAWVTWRISRAKLSHANMTQGSIIYPGIKTWLSDEIGLIIGPLMAPTLPKNFHDEGIALANAYPVANRISTAAVAIGKTRFAQTDWFELHVGPPDLTGQHTITHYTFTPTTIVMLAALTTAWSWGLAVAVQKGLEKAIP